MKISGPAASASAKRAIRKTRSERLLELHRGRTQPQREALGLAKKLTSSLLVLAVRFNWLLVCMRVSRTGAVR